MRTHHELKKAMRGLLLEIDPNEMSTKPLTTELQALRSGLLRPHRAAEFNEVGNVRRRRAPRFARRQVKAHARGHE